MYELKIKSKDGKLNLNKEKEAIITSEDLAQPSSQKQTDTEPGSYCFMTCFFPESTANMPQGLSHFGRPFLFFVIQL